MRHHFIFLLQLCIVLINNTLCDFCCCCYRKGTNFQANHNPQPASTNRPHVVVATAKVRIFKQITTSSIISISRFSCCCYRKGTNFQANHNRDANGEDNEQLLLLPQRYEFSSKSQLKVSISMIYFVVVATAKVRIFKQITTGHKGRSNPIRLLLLPQRYEFSSKSQHVINVKNMLYRCCLEECFYRQAMRV